MWRRDAAAVGVADWAGSGGALGFRCGAGTPRLLAWQAWHLETSIFVSRGRRGTWWHRLLLWRGRRGTYGIGLALVARLVLGVAPGRRGCWRGRRGTWRHPPSFHVAGAALGEINTSAASLALLRALWHVCARWDCRTCVICSHLTPCSQTLWHVSVWMLFSCLRYL